MEIKLNKCSLRKLIEKNWKKLLIKNWIKVTWMEFVMFKIQWWGSSNIWLFFWWNALHVNKIEPLNLKWVLKSEPINLLNRLNKCLNISWMSILACMATLLMLKVFRELGLMTLLMGLVANALKKFVWRWIWLVCGRSIWILLTKSKIRQF